MKPASRTPEGQPNRCPVCDHEVSIEPSAPPGDATCPYCGHLLWFPANDVEEVFVHDMDVATKSEAIKTLVNRLVELGHVPSDSEDQVIAALLRREELGSTGIGHGIALPHATHPSITRLLCIMGRLSRTLDFDSLDGEPVNRVFLLLSPPDQSDDQVRLLNRIARRIRSEWE